MQILFLSIIAKCGVFTHVRELAYSMQRLGFRPVVGIIHNLNTSRLFKLTKKDMEEMIDSLKGIDYFLFESDEDLMGKIEGMNFQLVHAHSPIVLSSAIKAAESLNAPYVLTLHGVANWSKLHASAMEQAKAIIAIGPEVARSAGVEFQDKIRIIFNGIDTDRFKPGEIKTTNEPLRVLWMGRTNGPAANGVTYLSRAIRALRKKGIPIEAKVVGHALGADIGEMEACGWIHDPVEHLQRSHIVFARGRALREAMACGNIGFLIGQGYGGMVKKSWFEEDEKPILSGSPKHGYADLDSIEIMKDIVFFHHRRDLLEIGRDVARTIAVENFDIKKMVEDTVSLYDEALKPSRY